jgi:hypothetical protein
MKLDLCMAISEVFKETFKRLLGGDSFAESRARILIEDSKLDALVCLLDLGYHVTVSLRRRSEVMCC